MTFTAHIDHPDRLGVRAVEIRRDGQFLKHVGVVEGADLADMTDTCDSMLRRDGWQPPGGKPTFWWGSPDGNLFDGPWRAVIERT